MTGIDVLVLGGVGVDTIVRVPELRVPQGDYLPVDGVGDYVGHSGNGVALGFHALGRRTRFAALIGEDPQGALIRARYTAAGLDFTAVPAPNGTPRSVNLVDPAGRRFSFFDARHPKGTTMPQRYYLPLVDHSAHIHVATDQTPDVWAAARARGVTTSTDIHAWDGTEPWGVALARQADLVFLSAAAAPARIDELMRLILAEGRARVVVATEAEAGSRVLPRGEGVLRFPAVRPARPVVDSNGAGDAYSTAFTTRWLAGRPLAECALAGAVSGAFACGAPGTHEELITEPELAATIARTSLSAWRR